AATRSCRPSYGSLKATAFGVTVRSAADAVDAGAMTANPATSQKRRDVGGEKFVMSAVSRKAGARRDQRREGDSANQTQGRGGRDTWVPGRAWAVQVKAHVQGATAILGPVSTEDRAVITGAGRSSWFRLWTSRNF